MCLPKVPQPPVPQRRLSPANLHRLPTGKRGNSLPAFMALPYLRHFLGRLMLRPAPDRLVLGGSSRQAM